MKNIINLMICFLLLSSFLFISNANAVNISLVNSISVHEFNSANKEVLISEGKFLIKNQDDAPVTISLSVSNNIKSGDMGPNGEPRKHIVHPYIYFYPMPYTSWVVFDDDRFTIEANSEKLVIYQINIPVSEIPYFANTTNGFIGYINIIPISESGSSVGVNYQHKVFIEFKEGFELPIPILYVVVILLISILSIFVIIRLRLKDRKK